MGEGPHTTPHDPSADQAMRPREAVLQQFIEHAPAALAMFDADMRYIAASARWRRDYGLGDVPLPGRSHYELFPEISEDWRAVHRRCLAGAVERREDDLFVHADGRRQWMRWEVQPWRTESGRVGGLVIFAEDVTAHKDAETALRAREEQYRHALDAAEAGVSVWDARTNDMSWDAQLCEQFGLAPSDARVFETWVARVHQDDRARLIERLDQVRQLPGDDRWRMEFRVVRPDGTVRWVKGRGRAERDSEGRLTRMTVISLDITPRKLDEGRLRESVDRERRALEALHILLQTASQGIVEIDVRGVIRTANAAIGAMFGWDPAELVGQPIEQLLPATLRSAHARHRAAYFMAARPRPMGLDLDLVGQRKDGATFPVEVGLSHVATPDGGHAIAFVTDITARKAAEGALRQSHDVLEAQAGELQRRADQLRRLAVELTLADQHAREQLAKTLHDGLQQLLFSSRLTLDRLTKRLPGDEGSAGLVARARQDLDQAIAAARSLAVELFPPLLHDSGLPAALTWLAGSFEQKYGLAVDLTTDADANPDRRDVRILVFESVRELLFNVVKHAHVDRVAVELARTPEGAVRVTITDRGAGFDPAVVLHPAQSAPAGLGLFSVRERLMLLGGRLEVDSAPGRGARFTVVTPPVVGWERRDSAGVRTARAAGGAPSGSDGSLRGRPLTVLIADDHAFVRAGLRALLAEHSELLVVGEAENGREAIAQAHALHPDVVLMDVAMPHLDGIEATRRLRAELPSIHVFGLSTKERPNGLHAIEEAGAAGYFTKGDGAIDLLDRLLAVHAAGAESPRQAT